MQHSKTVLTYSRSAINVKKTLNKAIASPIFNEKISLTSTQFLSDSIVEHLVLLFYFPHNTIDITDLQLFFTLVYQ
jgi:hypothetical protein